MIDFGGICDHRHKINTIQIINHSLDEQSKRKQVTMSLNEDHSNCEEINLNDVDTSSTSSIHTKVNGPLDF